MYCLCLFFFNTYPSFSSLPSPITITFQNLDQKWTFSMKILKGALADGLSGLSASLWTERSLVLFPVGANAWVVGHVPSWGMQVAANWCFSLTLLFLSFFPPFFSFLWKQIFFKKAIISILAYYPSTHVPCLCLILYLSLSNCKVVSYTNLCLLSTYEKQMCTELYLIFTILPLSF